MVEEYVGRTRTAAVRANVNSVREACAAIRNVDGVKRISSVAPVRRNAEAISVARSTTAVRGANDEHRVGALVELVEVGAFGHARRALAAFDVDINGGLWGAVGRRELGFGSVDSGDARATGLEWGRSDEAGEDGERSEDTGELHGGVVRRSSESRWGCFGLASIVDADAPCPLRASLYTSQTDLILFWRTQHLKEMVSRRSRIPDGWRSLLPHHADWILGRSFSLSCTMREGRRTSSVQEITSLVQL